MKKEQSVENIGKRVGMQEIFTKIEKQSGYHSSELAGIWELMKQEMINCFQAGKSVDFGEDFGCMKTSLFIPADKFRTKKCTRLQVRFKAGFKLKKLLEIE
ncbi:hypothetical protein DWX43_17070 [Clostridium sp. AF19-22AC]|jgi:hypothetical protein|uniref:HU family DNA-binding protein n=1 Tax=Clostridia TaxID=186801 RepID=UPI000E4F78CB|nr:MULTISPECIES: hypothetical protein [Clostridia]RHR25836.1 hypothetical protein DWX43_17070 [Clostridium sp. AF19-22AC]